MLFADRNCFLTRRGGCVKNIPVCIITEMRYTMNPKHQEALLRELNQFTRRTHSLDEVYIFDLILCDNDIDRDGECFSDDALSELQKRFVGVTGIFDHDARSGSQTARIFCTALRTDPDRITTISPA